MTCYAALLKLDCFQALRDKTLYVRPPTNREAWWHPLQTTPEADSHFILAGDVNVMFCPFRTKLTACLTRSRIRDLPRAIALPPAAGTLSCSPASAVPSSSTTS